MVALAQYVEISKVSAVNAPSGESLGSSVRDTAPFRPNLHSINAETTTAVGFPLPQGSPFLLDSDILLPFMIGLLVAFTFRFVLPDLCRLGKLCHNGMMALFEGCKFCWSFLKKAGPKGQEKESPQPHTSPLPPPVPLTLTFSPISTQHTTPVDPSPVPPTLTFSPIFTQEIVPIDPPDTEEEESEVIEKEEVLPCEEAGNVCHPCPKYHGQFHHQCKAQTTRSEDPHKPAAVQVSVDQEQIEEAVDKALNKASDHVIQQVVDKVVPACKPDSADIARLLKSPEVMEALSRTVISNFKKDPLLSKLFHAEVNNTENIKKVLQLLAGMDDAEDTSIKAMLEQLRLDLITTLVSMQGRVHQLPVAANSDIQPSVNRLLEEISGEMRRIKVLRIKSPRSEQVLDKVQGDIERLQEKVTQFEKLILGRSRRAKTRRSARCSPSLKDSSNESSDDDSDSGDAPPPKRKEKTSFSTAKAGKFSVSKAPKSSETKPASESRNVSKMQDTTDGVFAPASIDPTQDAEPKGPEHIELVARQPAPRQPLAQQPVVRKPVVQEPVALEPVLQKPVDPQPVAKKEVAKKPVIQGRVNKKPVGKKQVTRKPVFQEPVAEKAVAEKAVTKQPTAQKPIAEKPIAPKPVVKLPTARQPVAQASPVAPLKLPVFEAVAPEATDPTEAIPAICSHEVAAAEDFARKFLQPLTIELSNLAGKAARVPHHDPKGVEEENFEDNGSNGQWREQTNDDGDSSDDGDLYGSADFEDGLAQIPQTTTPDSPPLTPEAVDGLTDCFGRLPKIGNRVLRDSKEPEKAEEGILPLTPFVNSVSGGETAASAREPANGKLRDPNQANNVKQAGPERIKGQEQERATPSEYEHAKVHNSEPVNELEPVKGPEAEHGRASEAEKIQAEDPEQIRGTEPEPKPASDPVKGNGPEPEDGDSSQPPVVPAIDHATVTPDPVTADKEDDLFSDISSLNEDELAEMNAYGNSLGDTAKPAAMEGGEEPQPSTGMDQTNGEVNDAMDEDNAYDPKRSFEALQPPAFGPTHGPSNTPAPSAFPLFLPEGHQQGPDMDDDFLDFLPRDFDMSDVLAPSDPVPFSNGYTVSPSNPEEAKEPHNDMDVDFVPAVGPTADVLMSDAEIEALRCFLANPNGDMDGVESQAAPQDGDHPMTLDGGQPMAMPPPLSAPVGDENMNDDPAPPGYVDHSQTFDSEPETFPVPTIEMGEPFVPSPDKFQLPPDAQGDSAEPVPAVEANLVFQQGNDFPTVQEILALVPPGGVHERVLREQLRCPAEQQERLLLLVSQLLETVGDVIHVRGAPAQSYSIPPPQNNAASTIPATVQDIPVVLPAGFPTAEEVVMAVHPCGISRGELSHIFKGRVPVDRRKEFEQLVNQVTVRNTADIKDTNRYLPLGFSNNDQPIKFAMPTASPASLAQPCWSSAPSGTSMNFDFDPQIVDIGSKMELSTGPGPSPTAEEAKVPVSTPVSDPSFGEGEGGSDVVAAPVAISGKKVATLAAFAGDEVVDIDPVVLPTVQAIANAIPPTGISFDDLLRSLGVPVQQQGGFDSRFMQVGRYWWSNELSQIMAFRFPSDREIWAAIPDLGITMEELLNKFSHMISTADMGSRARFEKVVRHRAYQYPGNENWYQIIWPLPEGEEAVQGPSKDAAAQPVPVVNETDRYGQQGASSFLPDTTAAAAMVQDPPRPPPTSFFPSKKEVLMVMSLEGSTITELWAVFGSTRVPKDRKAEFDQMVREVTVPLKPRDKKRVPRRDLMDLVLDWRENRLNFPTLQLPPADEPYQSGNMCWDPACRIPARHYCLRYFNDAAPAPPVGIQPAAASNVQYGRPVGASIEPAGPAEAPSSFGSNNIPGLGNCTSQSSPVNNPFTNINLGQAKIDFGPTTTFNVGEYEADYKKHYFEDKVNGPQVQPPHSSASFSPGSFSGGVNYPTTPFVPTSIPSTIPTIGFHDGDFSSDDDEPMKPISAVEGLKGAAEALDSAAGPRAAPSFVPQPQTSFPSADEVYYAVPPCGIKLADLKEKFKGRIECYPKDRWYTIVDNSTSVSNKLRFRKKTYRPVMSPAPSPPPPPPPLPPPQAEQPQWCHPDTGCRKRDCDFRDEHDCVGLTMTEEEYEEEEQRRRQILAAHKILKPKGHRRNGKMGLERTAGSEG